MVMIIQQENYFLKYFLECCLRSKTSNFIVSKKNLGEKIYPAVTIFMYAT